MFLYPICVRWSVEGIKEYETLNMILQLILLLSLLSLSLLLLLVTEILLVLHKIVIYCNVIEMINYGKGYMFYFT